MDINQVELDALRNVPVDIGKAEVKSAVTVSVMAVALVSWSRHEQRRLRLDVVGCLRARGGVNFNEDGDLNEEDDTTMTRQQQQ
jgi:hypothetical protein